MAINRLDLGADAIYQRGWVIDTLAELATFALTWASPLGPKRGDTVLCNEDNHYYTFVSGGVYRQAIEVPIASAVLPPTFDWQDVPFNAADYTASGAMTWTVTAPAVVVDRCGISYDGHTAIWNFSLYNYTIGGVSDFYLRKAFPFGYLPNAFFLGALGFANDAGGGQTAFAWVAGAGQAYVEIALMTGVVWGTGVGIGEIDFTIMYEVQ